MATIQAIEFSLRMIVLRAPIPGVSVHLNIFTLLYGAPFLIAIRLIANVRNGNRRVFGGLIRFLGGTSGLSRSGLRLHRNFLHHLIKAGQRSENLRVLGVNAAPSFLINNHFMPLARGRDQVIHCDARVRTRSGLIVINNPLHPIIECTVRT